MPTIISASGQASETNLADSPISKYLCPLRIIIHFLPRPSVIYPHDSSFDGGKGFALVCAPELLNYTRWPIGTFFRLYVEGPPPLIDYTPLFGSNWTPILAVDHRRTKYYTESGTGRINVAIFLKPWPWAVSSVNIRIARAFRDADQDIRNVYLGWPAKRWKELYTSTVRDLQVNGAQELLLDERGEAKIAPNLLF